jgi:hypothetical protein
MTMLVAFPAIAFALSGTAHADRTPLLGSGAPVILNHTVTVTSELGSILEIDPATVPCTQIATFEDVVGGDPPGTDYDGLLESGGLLFAERFAGQSLSYSGDFDVVSGIPTSPLILQQGLPGQNLDVFNYSTNVLTGLGHIGYPDIDAIGEGSIAMLLPIPQSKVSLQLVGGNGGSATLTFYRTDGSLIDTIIISGLAELYYGFATADGSNSIAGILIQSTDPSGIGVDNICHFGGVVGTHALTWGQLKVLYH